MERRLQELERETSATERQSAERERRPEQWAAMSEERQEVGLSSALSPSLSTPCHSFKVLTHYVGFQSTWIPYKAAQRVFCGSAQKIADLQFLPGRLYVGQQEHIMFAFKSLGYDHTIVTNVIINCRSMSLHLMWSWEWYRSMITTL